MQTKRIVVLTLGLMLGLGLRLASAEEPAAAELLVKSGQKIAFLGDSITAGGMAPLGYVSLTIAGLKANGIEATAIGAGVSGHKSNQMLERLERDVINKKPDCMTLSCGVNDVWLEQIEAYLDRQDRKDAAALLQESLAKRIEELKK